MPTKLDKAVAALGKYYGATGKSDFMARLVSPTSPAEDAASEDPTPAEFELANIFLDIQEGGLLIPMFLDNVNDTAAGAGSEFTDALKKTLLVSYETEWGSSDALKADCSIKEVCASEVINQETASPSKTAPGLSLTQIWPSKLTLANRDTGAISLFCNAIPTIEISKCVPYIDMTIVTPKAPLSADGRIQTMSISQFLMGQKQLDADSVDYTFASAVSSEVMQEFNDDPPPEPEEGSEPTGDPALPAVASAGMELFTAPQTLVNADEDYHDYEVFAFADGQDEDAESPALGGARGAGIIDKFRPFMTFSGLKINVTPTTGFMSHKTANFTLVLHDRSRLSEIAPFVKPDLYGSTEIILEYGWSHPDGGPESENAFGMFLDSMRCKEKYMIVNSSFKFDEVGQVNVDIKLAMKGAAAIDTTSISKGNGVEDALETVGTLTEAMSVLRSRIQGASGGSENVSGETFLSSASDTSRSMSIDDETRQKIVEFIRDNRNADADSDIGQVVSNLEGLYGSDGRSGAVADLQATIAAAVAAKIATVNGSSSQRTPDPWLRGISSAASFVTVNPGANPPTHVSLGKLLTSFCGLPLAATGRFDDIQLLFYAFNSKASYVKDFNISQFPINIREFETKFKEKTKTTANLPISAFLGFIKSNFISNQAADAWGMAALYETDDEGNTKIKEDYEDSTALYGEKQKRLEDAYGEGEELVFKMPRITMYIETVRVNDSTSTGGSGTSAGGGGAQTVMRIHIYDKQCTAYESIGAMLGAAQSNSVGLLGKAASAARRPASDDDDQETNNEHEANFMEQLNRAIDEQLLEAIPSVSPSGGEISVEEMANKKFRIRGGFPALKGFVARTMPNIIYGSNNSAVLNANVASMNNPQLASVNMMRGGMGAGTTAQGARDAGVPLSVSPVKCDLTIIGCPVITFGQQFFIDFGTGTNVDNVYAVSGIDHSLGAGKFETKVKLVQLDAFGKYTSLISNVENAIAAINEEEGPEDD